MWREGEVMQGSALDREPWFRGIPWVRNLPPGLRLSPFDRSPQDQQDFLRKNPEVGIRWP